MIDASKPGWRERKRRETHKRVWESAVALFGARGYDATTLDAIAEASGISKRTFFHYFKSKEEVLVAWQESLPDMLRAAVVAEKEGDTPLAVLRNVFAKMPAHFDVDQAVLIGRIIRSSPRLQASNLAKYMRLEQAAFEALCERWPDPEDRSRLKIVAMAVIGALRLAIDAFADEGGQRPLAKLMEDTFAGLAAEISDA